MKDRRFKAVIEYTVTGEQRELNPDQYGTVDAEQCWVESWLLAGRVGDIRIKVKRVKP